MRAHCQLTPYTSATPAPIPSSSAHRRAPQPPRATTTASAIAEPLNRHDPPLQPREGAPLTSGTASGVRELVYDI